MEEIYGTAKLGKLSLEPDMEAIMAHSRDPHKLLMVWKGWRDVTGPKLREKYSEFVRLSNIGAMDNGENLSDVVSRAIKFVSRAIKFVSRVQLNFKSFRFPLI